MVAGAQHFRRLSYAVEKTRSFKSYYYTQRRGRPTACTDCRGATTAVLLTGLNSGDPETGISVCQYCSIRVQGLSVLLQQAQGLSVLLQQAQDLSVLLQQVQGLSVLLQGPGLSVLLQQAQGLSVLLQQVQGLSVLLQQVQGLSVLLQGPGLSVLLQQVQGLSVLLQQAQGLSVLLQQAQGLSVLLQQAQGLSVLLQQVQGLSVLLQGPGLSVLLQQVQGLSVLLQQAQSLSVLLQQAQGLSVLLQQVQGLSVLLQQVQGLSVLLQQAQGLSVLLQQVQGLSVLLQGPGLSVLLQQVQDCQYCSSRSRVSQVVSNWSDEHDNELSELKRPPQSPDLGPVQHLWNAAEREIPTTDLQQLGGVATKEEPGCEEGLRQTPGMTSSSQWRGAQFWEQQESCTTPSHPEASLRWQEENMTTHQKDKAGQDEPSGRTPDGQLINTGAAQKEEDLVVTSTAG
ncbi:hypothetical protein P4O66_001568 [Electrophorus voltai]|uniref:Uncharacterized protein n=1 Tax=Electrophorus voltai TaxID=2609070 RepID=A0AAD9DV25_9TELE|nr:hypothetical protein P4O66_001568 [Electrophorus voltai]